MALNFLNFILSALLLIQLTTCVAACPQPISDLCKCTRWIEGLQLVCSGANFTEVISALQEAKEQIQILEYKDGNLTELTEDMFANISIKEINLSGNKISKVDKTAFSSVALVLEKLTLANNSLPSVINLSGLEELRSLDLAGNMISTVEAKVFSENPKLRELIFDNNKICSLPMNALNETKETLEQLSLAGNCLIAVPAATLRGCQRLTYLDLSDNNIPSLPNMVFMNLPRLKELRLNGNKIVTMSPMSFMNVPNLQMLYLRNNKIQILEPNRFQPFDRLQMLDLSENSINAIVSSSFKDMASLQQLFLDDNKIQKVETLAVSSCPELQVISIQNNKLTNLYRNAFDSLDSMVTLLMANNTLTTISRGAFAGMQNLQQLSLRNNKINKIEANALAVLPQLTTLDLGNNDLDIVPSDVFGDLKELFWLDLCCNGIKTLSEGTFGQTKVKNILLHDNTLVCDDGLDWFITYVVNKNIRVFVPGQPEVVCAGPPDLKGIRLKDVMIKKANSSFHNAIKTLSPNGANPNGNLLENMLPALKELPGGAALAESLPSLTDIFSSTPGATGLKSITDPILNGISTVNTLGTLSRAVEDFTGPLSSLIQGGGTPEQGQGQFNNLFGSIPNLISNIPGKSGGPGGFAGLKISDIPPEVLQHIMSGGTLPGVPKAFMDSLVTGYMRNMALAAANAQAGKETTNGVETSTYLPPLDSFPPELIQQFINGKSLPGLTDEETSTIKNYYISQAVNTNTTTPGDGNGNAVTPPTDSGSGSPSGAQPPRRRLVSAAELLSQLPRNFDLSKLPRSLLQDFAAGRKLDLAAIPKSVIDQIRKTNPDLIARLEGSMTAELPVDVMEEKKEVVDPSHPDFINLLPATRSPVPPVETFRPYDLSDLDRQNEVTDPAKQSGERIAMYTAIGLSVVGLATIALIAYLCVKRQRAAKAPSNDEMDSTKFFTSSPKGSLESGVNSGVSGLGGSYAVNASHGQPSVTLFEPYGGGVTSPNPNQSSYVRSSPSWVYSTSGLPDYRKTEMQTFPS